MKTPFMTTVVFTALSLISNFTVQANPNHRIQKSAKERVRNEIAGYITCPDFIEDNSPVNRVKAIVQVDENGNVKILEINSANPRLKDYVLGRFQNVKVTNPGEAQKFVLIINFQVTE